MRNVFIFTFVFFLSTGVTGQVVEQINSSLLNGPDGMAIDKGGNLFVANWGKKGDGTTIVRLDKFGEESVFADSLAAPDGLAFDKMGNLFVSCFGSGEVIRIGANGDRFVLARGLDHPGDLKFDDKGQLFVSSFGNFNGTKVYKITMQGEVTTYADSLSVPLGLAISKTNELHISSFATGVIIKVDTKGKKHVVARLPNKPPGYFQYLAFDSWGNLYCPSFGHNKIYFATPKGEFGELTLSNASGNEMKLNGPNSIVIEGSTLYFTEFTTNAVYKVTLK